MNEKIELFTAQCCARCKNLIVSESLGPEPGWERYFYCRKTGLAVKEHYYCRHFVDVVTDSSERYRIPSRLCLTWEKAKRVFDSNKIAGMGDD